MLQEKRKVGCLLEYCNQMKELLKQFCGNIPCEGIRTLVFQLSPQKHVRLLWRCLTEQ
jgi:hypothetical protein